MRSEQDRVRTTVPTTSLALDIVRRFRMGKLFGGVLIAGALAVSASDATLFGIAAWKIVLAAAGAMLFVLGAERRPQGRR